MFHTGWMRTMMGGKLNEEAPTLPEEAADRIIRRIDMFKDYKGNLPPHINNDNGEILPW